MKNTKIIVAGILGLTLALGTTSCKKKGCTDSKATNYDANAKKDDGSCDYPTSTGDGHNGYHVMFKMAHKYDGASVMPSDFNDIKYTNDFGTHHSITKIKYLVSDFVLYKADGDSVVVDGYNLVDFTNPNSFAYENQNVHFPAGDYTGVGFAWGFDDDKNTTGAYADLNASNWSWPAMIGGGYHYMQFEGRFIDANNDTLSFQYHNGRAKNPTSGAIENNNFHVKLNNAFTLSGDASVTINMDMAEWFKNPNQWDLDTLHSMLMPNYQAQIMMNQNGRTVFSFGSITQ